jgi:hypothetical protein
VTRTWPELGTRISPDRDHRLRLLVMVRRGKLGAVLDDVLDGALPDADQLAEQLRQKGASGDEADR